MAITINGTTGIAGVDGSASTPSYQGADTNTGIFYPAADTIAFAEGGAEVARFDSNGRLGIGTTSPAGRLSANLSGTAFSPSQTTGIGGGTSARAQFTGPEVGLMLTSDMDSSGTQTGSSTVAMGMQVGIYAVSDIRNQIWWSGGYPLTFTYSSTPGGSPTERARITSGGSFLVGATTTFSPGGVASAHGFSTGTSTNWALGVQNTQASSPWGIGVIYPNATPNTNSYGFLFCQDSSATRAYIYSNGGLANYSGNNVNLSDRREKTNFAPAKNYLDVICAIPVQTFNYIDQNNEDDPGLTLGVVAQDVQEVAPELVSESNWGTQEEPKMRLSIYQTDLQYALMKCIQELKAELDTTKARLAALEAQ